MLRNTFPPIHAGLIALVLGVMPATPASAGLIGYGVYEGNGDLYTVDLDTGSTTLVGPTGFAAAGGLAYNPLDGYLYGIVRGSDGELIRIDPATGAGASVGLMGISMASPGFAIDAGGNAFVSSGSGPLYSINLATAATTLIGSTIDTDGMAFAGNTLYAVSDSLSSLYTIDTSTGAATLVGSFGFTPVANGLGLASDGTSLWVSYYAGSNQNFLAAIDPATAASTGTVHALAGLRFTNLEIAPAATTDTPEPSTLTLGSAGALLIFLGTFKRKTRG